MNLIDDAWLPLRNASGAINYTAPVGIADAAVVDVAMPRPDFQGAAWQWLIALLQTTCAPRDHEEWADRWADPPDPDELQAIFSAVRHAFWLTGDDGPRFMQDYDLPEDARTSPISGLLIEAPGAQTLKNNADHFVKRGGCEAVSPASAAIALFTMQINAPSGGKGYRTGLRGGGPLTTFVLPDDPATSLWRKLWLNVIPRDQWSYEDPDFHDWRVFPWLARTRVSEGAGTATYPEDVHPLHMYWAMPRRFVLEVEDAPCVCDLSGAESSQSVRSVRTTNYGYNYEGAWDHPLTPYRFDPKKPQEAPLSQKGQQGGLGYRHWESLSFEDREERGLLPARVVRDYARKADVLSELDVPERRSRLWAFGYDMDNMKARGWYATEMPLVAVADAHLPIFRDWIRTLTEPATAAAWRLRNEVKAAWFSRPKDAKGDFSTIDLRFWEATEAEFYECVQGLSDQVHTTQDSLMPPEIAEYWRNVLHRACERIFDEMALSGDAEGLDMKRITAARNSLHRWLWSGKEMKALRQRASKEAA